MISDSWIVLCLSDLPQFPSRKMISFSSKWPYWDLGATCASRLLIASLSQLITATVRKSWCVSRANSLRSGYDAVNGFRHRHLDVPNFGY